MDQLEVRLLGGFDVRYRGQAIRRFESQKARALFAYLVMHSHQALSRDHLAGLLWSERDQKGARRNLRQVLYSIRTAFAEIAPEAALLDSGYQEVRVAPELDLWLDVREFERATDHGLTTDGIDVHHLSRAARLYQGDFLSGFYVRDCSSFEEWLLLSQERLREAALHSLRTLVDSFLSRNDARLGIFYARRLLALDPMSEEAHRQLMRLYLRSGRRTRALAQYEELRNLLNLELGVDPLEETTALYRSILLEQQPAEETLDEPLGPLIPLAGRSAELAALQAAWDEVVGGTGRFTAVVGPAGSGKSRLVKSFVDSASSRRKTLVLSAASYESAALAAYAPLAEIVTSVFANVMPDEEFDPERLPAETVADLCLLAPPLAHLEPDLLGGRPDLEAADPGRLGAALRLLLAELCRQADGSPTPLIVMLHDLHWADSATLDLLAELSGAVAGLPAWIVATCDPTAPASHPLLAAVTAAEPPAPFDRLTVGPLDLAAVHEVAGSLVASADSRALADLLLSWSAGLPLAMTELINFLWDEDVLIAGEGGRWSFQPGRLSEIDLPENLASLLLSRFRKLPASARRLLAVAGIVGQRFDVGLVQRSADEHLAVVEPCVELMLQRWLIRQFPRTWTHTGRERDIVLWARGARRGTFQFAHARIRSDVLADINPLRRRLMHRDVATALLERHGDDLEPVCEIVAHHCLEAGEHRQALPCLELAAARARRCGAERVERWYLERCAQVLERLAGEARREAARSELEQRGADIRERLAAMAAQA